MKDGAVMRNLFLWASGTLGLLATSAHAVLSETHVFAHVRIDPERLKVLIHGVWHCGTVAWACIAVLLIAAPSMGSQVARHWIVGAAVAVYVPAVIVNAWATQGRHFGWALFAIVVGLAVAGL
jgi:hypothetical protein